MHTVHTNFQVAALYTELNCTLGTVTQRSVRACLILNSERPIFFFFFLQEKA